MKMQPRPYQQDCVQKIKAGNTIVSLPTGAGKTLVAVLSIDFFLSRPGAKRVMFVVPTTVLVKQQAEYCRDRCETRRCVAELSGTKMDAWTQQNWSRCLQDNVILVGTPEVFRRALVDCGFIQVLDFSLIIFDECHNATGNSPMAGIMRDAVWKVTAQRDCPRILGLTASFVNGALKNVEQKRKDLETLLQSSLFCPDVPEEFAAGGAAGSVSKEKFQTVNWQDDVPGIVALGILQIFVLPHVLAPQHAQYVGIFSFSRLFRVTRMMRHMSFNWTENDWFQYLSGGVICLNAAVLGFETDSPNPAWWWVNQGILLFFVFEIVVRIRLEGCRGFFISEEDIFWNWMDFVIVLLGVFDLWAIPMGDLILGTKTSNGFGRLVLLVRMLRMLRILRLLKLVKAVRPLYSLALGVTQAMQSIFWVLVFLVVTLYAFAILATRLLGHSDFVQESDDLPVASKELFCSIWDSMFALFSIMNQQNWEAMGPLLDKVPAIKPVYVLFTICSSWALLSVLTGVVSDNMMAVRESQAQKDEEAVEERRIWLARWLRGVFAAADRDGSMTLERSEYRELLKSPFHLKRLQQVAKVPMQDLMQMFDILDVDHNGLIEFQEFLVGFEWLNEPISGKSLLRLGHEIRVSCQAVEKLLHSLGGELDRLCSRQLDQQTRLENKFREVVEARRKLKEECDKTFMAQAKAYEARAELAGLMEQYKVITMSEADEDELHPEEDTLADMVIQTPTNKHQETIISTSVLKTESLQAQTSGTEKRFDTDQSRSKSTSKASSYAILPEDNDVNPSIHTPLGMRTPLGGAGGVRGRMMGRSMSRLDGG